MVAGLWVRWLGLLLTVMLLLAVVVTVVIVTIDETLTQAVTDQAVVMQEDNALTLLADSDTTVLSEWTADLPWVTHAFSAGQSNGVGQIMIWGMLALLCFVLFRLCVAKLHQRWGKEVNKNREGHNHEP